jgi:hypothetical protein
MLQRSIRIKEGQENFKRNLLLKLIMDFKTCPSIGSHPVAAELPHKKTFWRNANQRRCRFELFY